MKLTSQSFPDGGPMPAEYAFARIAETDHVALSDNKNPRLAWDDVPEGTRSFALICVDTDVPTKPDDVNQEGRTVPADLPRTDFYHWVMVDIPADLREIEAGSCSEGVTPGGKKDPAGPAGTRQGVQDYTAWFAGDEGMKGSYFGYDGPGPPWNDELVHHYHFQLCALDLERVPVEGDFQAKDVLAAIEGHVLAQAEWVGTYSLNPDVAG